MKSFIELFRGGKWRRTGIIWWNLLDGWPQFSDAVIDYYFEKKLAYHYIRRVQVPVCLMLKEPCEGRQRLAGVNDRLAEAQVRYRLWDADSGKVSCQGEARLAANAATDLGAIDHVPATRRFFIIEWECGGGVHRNHYLAGEPPFDLNTYLEWMHKVGRNE